MRAMALPGMDADGVRPWAQASRRPASFSWEAAGSTWVLKNMSHTT